jgi:site-specific DNA recombinase
VKPELYEKALARLEENRRYSGGRGGRKYLLRGLVWCSSCGTAYTGDPSRSSTGYLYHYYGCRKKRTKTYDKRAADLLFPRVKAEWLEKLVWVDVRCFLENPGALIKRVRQQLAED